MIDAILEELQPSRLLSRNGHHPQQERGLAALSTSGHGTSVKRPTCQLGQGRLVFLCVGAVATLTNLFPTLPPFMPNGGRRPTECQAPITANPL